MKFTAKTLKGDIVQLDMDESATVTNINNKGPGLKRINQKAKRHRY